jgi:hypothetical protein
MGAPEPQTFRTEVELGGKTATGFEVPSEVVDALGSGKKPSVTVTVGSHTYRSTVFVRGGRFFIPLSAENREAAGVAAGDAVEVTVVLDTAPRVVEVPDDLADALAANPKAKAAYEALSYSHQRAHVEPIVAAKKPETRERRIAKAVEMLQA